MSRVVDEIAGDFGHPDASRFVTRLLRLGEQGHAGVQAAVDHLREAYNSNRGNRNSDLDSMLSHRTPWVAGDPTDGDRNGCNGARGCGTSAVLERDPGTPSSWVPVDLSVVLADGYEPPAASLGTFGGTGGLFYPGEVNTIAGPSGVGKSWVAVATVAEELHAGRDCLYIDHEATAATIASRLRCFGVSTEVILRHLTYVNPADAHTVDLSAWNALLSRTFSVAVVDGVTAAMNLYGGGTNEQDAVARWFEEVPKPLARQTGAAVITVDHVSKTGGSSGFAVGSQHKRAAVTGVSYNVELNGSQLAPGCRGTLKLVVGKDRHGDVLSRSVMNSNGSVAASLTFDATSAGVMKVERDGVLAMMSGPDLTDANRRANIGRVLAERGELNTNSLFTAVGEKKLPSPRRSLRWSRAERSYLSSGVSRTSTPYQYPLPPNRYPPPPIGGVEGVPVVGLVKVSGTPLMKLRVPVQGRS